MLLSEEKLSGSSSCLRDQEGKAYRDQIPANDDHMVRVPVNGHKETPRPGFRLFGCICSSLSKNEQLIGY